MNPATLIIFDYSGTLSLGAVDFGRRDNLSRQLAKSGLAGIGIDTADRYWNKVVNPTWSKASTTTTSFKSIAADCIQNIGLPGTAPQAIASAVSKFVDVYLHHSGIDEPWHPLLSAIQDLPGVTGLVATDHYAEATAAIQAHLAALDIESVSATANTRHGDGAFIVANSADIGYPKADRRFWLTLKKVRLAMPVKAVVLVDDFGLSEPDRSGYSDPLKIEARIGATRKALGAVFKVKPQIIHFIAGKDPGRAILETTKTLQGILKR